MKHQRIIETIRIGPLEVSADPPIFYWRGIKRNFRPHQIRLLHAIAEFPKVDPDELFAKLGFSHPSTLHNKLSQLRATLDAANIPLRIVGVPMAEGRRIDHYKLEIAT